MDTLVEPIVMPTIEEANCTLITIASEYPGLLITPMSEYEKAVSVIFVVGAIVGILSWELFKYARNYGRKIRLEREAARAARESTR